MHQGLKDYINVSKEIMAKSRVKPKVQILLLDPLPINLFVHFRSAVIICEYPIKFGFYYMG